ncbi:phosphoglucosamine mutase [Anaerorhabdus furcosa]|uniref:Phosphoglucosamine mutase n=1 Tax=Anaerorhabdus furcosa TaxID=118967 RepID=A0A1T4JZV1_9FIRM|nr:phosphoglucosamine mutase [Anaerorhabdus furcosa]SJZ35701.1 phosphoglucosamine mutase [Anaerorhabdus furcosa]
MGRYFGTDGIRGKANVNLDAERAFKVGRYLAYYYKQKGLGKILIGKDTRLSSSMFELALAAGATANGADVYLLGYCPTPAVAYLVMHKDFDCGVMISASHNPYYDNGIKVFNHDGVKLDSSIEGLIEDYIDGKEEITYATDDKIGHVINYQTGLELYLDWLEQTYPLNLKGVKLAVDCANGSASTTAVQLLTRLGATVSVIHNDPTGVNINTKCGSTHPEELQEKVKNGNFDLGLAFDGDADRLIAVDHTGELITGDHVIYVCSKYLKAKGELNKNTAVTTVMANLGLFKALEVAGIDTSITAVGDKYVYEDMVKNDYVIGGEQSGHIIFKKHLTTGDGLQTALNLLEIMVETKKNMTELCEGLKIYPQLLVNVPVKDKEAALKDEDIQKEVDDVTARLAGNGRILVRPSGTEPLVRVMVEAENDEICHDCVYQVVRVIEKKFQ